MPGPRTVAVAAFESAQMLDIVGPAEVFAIADRMAGGGAYRVVIASADGSDCVSSSGFRVGVEHCLDELDGPIDVLVVPGTYDWEAAVEQPGLVPAPEAAARRSRRVAAVCAGAFLVGAIGLLDGRRATTHWLFTDALAQRHPTARVEHDPIFIEDGRVLTSAGVTAGIDLALAMVETDLGPELARQVARYLVVFMQRPGGQDQFSVRLRTQPRSPSPLRPLLDAIAADPAADHRLAALSEQVGFSERHLTRIFVQELGTTPAGYVEEIRIEAARSMLQGSDAPLEVVAKRSGMGSTETLRRAFVRKFGVSPTDYRRRFRTTGAHRP